MSITYITASHTPHTIKVQLENTAKVLHKLLRRGIIVLKVQQ